MKLSKKALSPFAVLFLASQSIAQPPAGYRQSYAENFHETPLMMAAYRNDDAAILKSLDEKADVNAENDLGLTALYYAAGATPLGQQRDDSASAKTVELLLNHGADIHIAGKKTGITPLMAAVQNNLPRTVELLIRHGADINARSLQGTTALIDALDGHRWPIVNFLLDRKADVSGPPDINGDDVLLHAVKALRLLSTVPAPSVSTLLLQGMSPEGTDMIAGAREVERLLAEGAKTDRFDNSGESAFLSAALECHNLLVMAFVEHGVDVNQKDRTAGRTALIDAARCGNTPMTQTLLKAHADSSLKDSSGKTALDYAKEANAREIVQLLRPE